jgi:raffinose/stachyose/melibiose transport system permease protein
VTLDAKLLGENPRVERNDEHSRRRVAAMSTATAHLWLVPAVALVTAVVYYSVGYTVRTSFLDWDGVGPERRNVGFDNYTRLWHDPIFRTAVRNLLMFGVVTVVVSLLLGLAFAVVLHSSVRWKGLYKVLVFVPVVISPAATAPVFRQLVSEDGGVHSTMRALGLGGLYTPWLASPTYALWVLMFIAIWHSIGFNFVFYYASVTQLDQSVIEAARCDGAGAVRIVWSIVLPMMRGTTYALVLLGCIGALRTFDVPYLVTGGGPARSTEFPGTYIYEQAIQNFHAGYGAALTVVLTVAALFLAALQPRVKAEG